MSGKLPKHVVIVMDGNGRWAESQDLPRVEGHLAGVEAIRPIVQHCLEKKIAVLSLFAFSSENWARPQQEVNFLMQLFITSLSEEVKALHEHGIRLRFIGDKARLDEPLCEAIAQAEKLTAANQHLHLNIMLNYGGRWDIVEAAKKLATQVKAGTLDLDAFNENVFNAALSTADLPEPDLFIRTSGEQRISNFLLWQVAYTELFFSPLYWPDFTTQEFEKALVFFADRSRRYGKTSKQLKENSDV